MDSPSPRPLFRDEALQVHLRAREFGDVLRLPPRWTRLAYPLVVALALAGILLLGFGRVREHARGPAAIRAAGDRFTAVALIPASALPALRVGQRLALELAGYPAARVELVIERLPTRAVGRAAARAALGAAADEAEIPDAAVLLELPLAQTAFRTSSGEQPFHDGMRAEAEAVLGSERLLFVLVPGLKSVLRG